MSAHRVALALLAAALAALLAAPVAGAGQAAKKPEVVKVRDDYYSPTKVKVRKGGVVKWKWGNVNTDPHDVTLKKGPKGVKKFHSLTGSTGITFKHKFKAPGRYHFFCTIHPDVMQMQVVVKK